MRIATATVRMLRVPPVRQYQAAGRTVDAFWHVLAEVTTTEGVHGFGYTVALASPLVSAMARACRELSEGLVGMHVLQPEAAWQKLMRKGSWMGPGGLLHFAVSPLDIALWDAAGKSIGQPLYRMLGGYRDRLPVYASDGFWYSLSLDELAESARRAVSQGFSAVKLRLGHESSPAKEVQRVNAVREAVGPDIRILVDATETWDAATALNTGHALQEAGIHWLEDPIAHDDVAGLSRLRSQLRVQIATGEHLYRISDFTRLCEARATGIALIDLGRIGGITPWRHAASVAHAYGIPVCGHVLPEMHLHLACGIPNGYLVEYVPRSERILQGMPALAGGCLVVPERPGHGLELDHGAVKRFTVDS